MSISLYILLNIILISLTVKANKEGMCHDMQLLITEMGAVRFVKTIGSLVVLCLILNVLTYIHVPHVVVLCMFSMQGAALLTIIRRNNRNVWNS